MQNAFEAIHDLDCEVWCVSTAGKPAPNWRCDRFFGRVPHDQMKRIYSSCDVLLKMSEVESFCLPPLEMMACGQGACVIGEVTGIEEYVRDGADALVVKQGDVEAARQAVQRLIEDEELRRRLIENGLETARQFNWDSLTAQLQQIICSPVGTGLSMRPPAERHNARSDWERHALPRAGVRSSRAGSTRSAICRSTRSPSASPRSR